MESDTFQLKTPAGEIIAEVELAVEPTVRGEEPRAAIVIYEMPDGTRHYFKKIYGGAVRDYYEELDESEVVTFWQPK